MKLRTARETKPRGHEFGSEMRDAATLQAVPDNLEDLIARRAHELYEQRGGEHGRDLDDWLEAERQIFGQG